MRIFEFVAPLGIICLALAACQDTARESTTTSPAAPTASQPKLSESSENNVQIMGLNFALISQNGTCQLKTPHDKTLDLGLDEACKFHRESNEQIQIEDGHHGPVFLIISSVPDAETDDCTTRIASVTVADGKTYVAPAQSATASCVGNEKMDSINFLAPRFEGLPYPE